VIVFLDGLVDEMESEIYDDRENISLGLAQSRGLLVMYVSAVIFLQILYIAH